MKRTALVPLMLIVTFVTTTTMSSCIGDAAIRVTGSIVDQKGTQVEGCKLELRMEKNEFLADWQKVGGSFVQLFTVAPGDNRIFFTVSCDGVSTPHRTTIFEVKGAAGEIPRIDLGTIQFETVTRNP